MGLIQSSSIHYATEWTVQAAIRGNWQTVWIEKDITQQNDPIQITWVITSESSSLTPMLCLDSSLGITARGGATCSVIAVNIEYCEYNGVSSHCPLVCDACSQFECADSAISWDYGGSSYTCEQLASLSDPDIAFYCEDEAVYSTCCETCKTCDL